MFEADPMVYSQAVNQPHQAITMQGQALDWQQHQQQQIRQQQQHQHQEHIHTEAMPTVLHPPKPLPATTALENVEIGIPADSQVAVACGYMTRAKQSLAHITLDELEQTLPLPEEKLLPLEDGEEYQYFLQALELEDLPEDDDEDIDFTLEGLLGPLESDLDEDMAEAVVEAPRNHGKAAVKRSRRHAATQDPSRRLPVLPRRAAISSEVLGVPACDIMTEHAQLAAPLAEPDTQLNPETGAGEPLTYTLWPPEPDERPRGFDADQTQQLYLQLNHHSQMMIETYALTACNKDHQEAAVTLANLLAEYQGHSKHLLQAAQHPPYSPHLLGLGAPHATHSPEQLAAPPSLQVSAPVSSQEHSAAPANSAQDAAQSAVHNPGQLVAAHSLPVSAPVSRQEQPAASSDPQEAAQGGALCGSDSPGATGSASPACGTHAAAIQQGTVAAVQTTGKVRLASGAQPSDSGTTVTENAARVDDAVSKVPALTYEASMAGNSGESGAQPAQMQGDSSGMSIAATGRQHREEDMQQQAGVTTGAPSPSCSPLCPGESSANAWRPTAELPVHSITQVACMHLLPDFLDDIGQVRVQLGMPHEPEYRQTRTLGSTTGGFYPDIVEAPKKVSPPAVPLDVKLAVAKFKPYFDPAFFPKFQALPQQITWTTAEDELLAVGLLRYGMKYEPIQENLLPMKSTKEMYSRQKNRCHRVDHNCIRAAKEHITRPMDPAEVRLIDRAMQAFQKDYRKQRRLEDLHGLPSSRKDSRTVSTNRWRLLTVLPELGLQSRTGQVLRQLYDEAVHNIPKTSHTGDPPGTKRPRAPKAPDLPVVQDNLLTEPLTSPPQQPQKKQGGPRPILLQPPISLLFDDPAEEKEGPKEPHIVSGRVAKTRQTGAPKKVRRTKKGVLADTTTVECAQQQTGQTMPQAKDSSAAQQPSSPPGERHAGSLTQQGGPVTAGGQAPSSGVPGATPGVEVAEGIPAPFPLVAHNPTAQAPRPSPKAPRQASRATTATQAFTTCLVSDPPQAPPRDQGATQAQDPAMISSPTKRTSGAPDPRPHQHDGRIDQGYGDVHVEPASTHCDDRLEHAGHEYQHLRHAQQHAPADTEMTEAPVDELAHLYPAAEHSAAEELAHPYPAAEHSAHPEQAAHTYSAAEHSAHTLSAAEHPAHAHSAALQSAPLQFHDLPDQPCKGFQLRQAPPACQQEGYTPEPAVQHADRPESSEAAHSAHLHPAEHHMPPSELEVPQRQQQHQQQQYQNAIGHVQHDQVLEQMPAPDSSAAAGSHQSPLHQTDMPGSRDTAQPGLQEPKPPPGTTAASQAAAAQAAAQSPHGLHPLPMLGSALLDQVSHHHAHSLPQALGLETAAAAHDQSTVLSSYGATPAAPVSAVVIEQPASATAAAAAAQSTPSNDRLQTEQRPGQQMQAGMSSPRSLATHDSPQQGQARTSPAASLQASPGYVHQLEHSSQLGAAQEVAQEEQFEQDVMSQPSSSESDEDFQPSEYEQDELSQPSSSSGADEDEDAFEVDELSQPETSSEDEQSPVRAESAPRVQSPFQAQPPHTVRSARQELPVSRVQSSRPQSAAIAASGRTVVKRSRPGSLSDDHKARLGFPKPPQPVKEIPVPKGYLTGSSLPFNNQSVSSDEGLKRTAQDAGAQQGTQQHMRTTASPSDLQKAPATAANPTSPSSGGASQQQQQDCPDPSPAKLATSQQQASLQTSQKHSAGKRAVAHHGHHHHQQQQHNSSQTSSVGKQTGSQQPQAQAALSYRKRPRKPLRPQCSGPSSFCQPPSPGPPPQRTSSKLPTGLSPPSSDRQLRPRQHTVGRWAAKRPRNQSSDKGSPEAPEGHASGPHKTSKGSPSSSKGVRSPSTHSQRPAAAAAAPAGGDQDGGALTDNKLMVDGVLTGWTDTADKSILFACMIQAQGQPRLEVFQGLVREIRESGCQVTLAQVQARFRWLVDRFLAAQAHRAVPAD